MKVLKTALLFLMCVSFSFSCKEGVKEVRVLKLAHGLPPSHSVHLGLLYMNERLKELSGGKMSMDIYSSAQLGSENQCIELLQIGSLDITKVSSAALEGFADPFKVFGIPYLFRSREQFFEVLDGSVGKQILGSTEPYWFRGLAYFDSGARSLYGKQADSYSRGSERTEDPCAKEPDSRGDDEDIRWFGYSRGLG